MIPPVQNYTYIYILFFKFIPLILDLLFVNQIRNTLLIYYHTKTTNQPFNNHYIIWELLFPFFLIIIILLYALIIINKTIINFCISNQGKSLKLIAISFPQKRTKFSLQKIKRFSDETNCNEKDTLHNIYRKKTSQNALSRAKFSILQIQTRLVHAQLRNATFKRIILQE